MDKNTILTLWWVDNYCSSVNLVGGSNPNEGNVFATNPRTNVYGPICAKAYWSTNTVGEFQV